jgi:hypothetical protein
MTDFQFVFCSSPESDALQWPQFDSVYGKYMVLDLDPHVEIGYRGRVIDLWQNVLPQLAASKPSDTIKGH